MTLLYMDRVPNGWLILDSFLADVPPPESEQLQLGFIEPGRGLKGKKEWILYDEDLKNILERCRSRKAKQLEL